MLTMNKIGFFPYTPATQMLWGLETAIEMLHEEGLDKCSRVTIAWRSTRRAVSIGARDHDARPEILFVDRHRRDDAGRP
jgi:aspartate aminotransferase-like enzyme